MNEDPQFDRRLLLAFISSALLFLIYLTYSKTHQPPPAEPAVATAPANGAAASSAQPPGAKASATSASSAAAAGNGGGQNAAAATPGQGATKPTTGPGTTAGRATKPAAASAEQSIAVDTAVYHVVFSNRGGSVRSWVLTQYQDENHKPLDLVDPKFTKSHGYPMSLWPSDGELRKTLDGGLYEVTRSNTDGGQKLEFHWSDGQIEASKSFTFDDSYVVQVHTEVKRNGQAVAAGLAWPGGFGDTTVTNPYSTNQLFQQFGDKVETFAAKKVTNQAAYSATYHLVGIEDQFFAAIFIPQDENTPVTVTPFKTPVTEKIDSLGVAVANDTSNDTRLFVGPKKIDLLNSIDPALRHLVDFGWFGVIADPLFLWMNWTHDHWIHNYGWDILFITVVLTLALFPLRIRAQKSQMKALPLQPKINALNAKMKKYPMRDPRRQEVQQEIMKVYSDAGVNPFNLGGCLPMLLTFPILIAFYRMLQNAIELRHAPWIGYVQDLSARDPYYLLPILVTVTMISSMAFMPPTPGADPKQQRMMKYMMPLFMGYIFFFLPSGVNLYYLGSNVIGTVQQVYINHHYAPMIAAAKSGKPPKPDKDKAGRK